MNTQAAGTQPQSLTEILLAISGAIALVTVVTGASILLRVDAPKNQDPQCASLARAMVNRSFSMLEGKASRAAVEQAYQACQSDPVAFRNLLR